MKNTAQIKKRVSGYFTHESRTGMLGCHSAVGLYGREECCGIKNYGEDNEEPQVEFSENPIDMEIVQMQDGRYNIAICNEDEEMGEGVTMFMNIREHHKPIFNKVEGVGAYELAEEASARGMRLFQVVVFESSEDIKKYIIAHNYRYTVGGELGLGAWCAVKARDEAADAEAEAAEAKANAEAFEKGLSPEIQNANEKSLMELVNEYWATKIG